MVQFVIGIVLARLLLPEQYGLIGMLSIFMAVAQSFVNSGFGSALIQKQDVTHIDTCSVFYFNILVGIVAAIVLCAIAPFIAVFYNQPILTPLTRAMSVIIVINSFALIQTSLLNKRIDFKTSTKVSLTASLTSGVVGIGVAYSGFGVWSLVAQQLVASIVTAALLWILNSWRPAWVFSFSSLRSMFGFGSRLLLSGLLNQIFANIYLLVIGKAYSATD
ncbi:MAG: oligosaccharide flippase family protein, partial [Candidatus Omnitrophica bacterium]|nr:oligosaccharide flippase family protein [Candidatus Omnitrophota bacterium]